ncbi:hypothetical protein N2152v2_008954 [Parachlorella kessleri]
MVLQASQGGRPGSLQLRVVVIGAGVAGLTAARALLDAGVSEVLLFERRTQDEVLAGGAGLGLAVNALAALKLLSGAQEGATLADDVAAIGCYDPAAVFKTWTGKTLTVLPTDLESPPAGAPAGTPPETGTYGVNVSRRNLQRTIYAALPPGTVRWGVGLKDFVRLDDGRVQVNLADGSSAVCDMLVGADGIHSPVRRLLDEESGGPKREPTYSGYMYCRGLVDLTKYPGGVEGWRKALGSPELCNGMFYGTTYQVTQTHAGIGRYHKAPEGCPRNLSPEQAKQLMQALTKGWGDPVAWSATAIEPEAVLEGNWGSGCVTLIGDAAHALLPTLGQGGCQGIEDAVELGVAIHRAAKAAAALAQPPDGTNNMRFSASDIEGVLRGFEATRGPRVGKVFDVSMGLFWTGVGETWLGRLRRDWTFWLLPVPLMRKSGNWLSGKRFSWDEQEGEEAERIGPQNVRESLIEKAVLGGR